MRCSRTYKNHPTHPHLYRLRQGQALHASRYAAKWAVL